MFYCVANKYQGIILYVNKLKFNKGDSFNVNKFNGWFSILNAYAYQMKLFAN